jgi:hypothetical protein
LLLLDVLAIMTADFLLSHEDPKTEEGTKPGTIATQSAQANGPARPHPRKHSVCQYSFPNCLVRSPEISGSSLSPRSGNI